MAKMSKESQEKFLSKTRYGILTTLAEDGSPVSVPVWFNWDGHAIRIFTGVKSAKVKRIWRDPRVTLLVANHLDEGEGWVAFDGEAKIRPEGAVELLEQLAAKYWDLSDPERRATVDEWKNEPNDLCVIELVPSKIRSQQD
jgi:PPOX class probable F420-dependent enzyme